VITICGGDFVGAGALVTCGAGADDAATDGGATDVADGAVADDGAVAADC